MRWPWAKYHEEHDAFGGEQAHVEATANLAEAAAAWPEVKRVAKSLRELRERNHFASQISLIYRGKDVE